MLLKGADGPVTGRSIVNTPRRISAPSLSPILWRSWFRKATTCRPATEALLVREGKYMTNNFAVKSIFNEFIPEIDRICE